MKTFGYLVASILLAGLASGCLGQDATTTDTGAEHSHEGMEGHEHGMHEGMSHLNLEMLEGFQVDFKGCREAGGVSLYDMPAEGKTGPTKDFRLHSIQDDTGNPKVGSYFRPLSSGGSSGIWHIAMLCDGHSFNGENAGPFEGGWVGQRVYPPAWDDSGIERQYFIADLSFNKGDIVDLIHEATGLHASRNLDAKVEILPGGGFHTILDDEDHGVFETHGKIKDWTPKTPLEKIRFWMLINPDGHGHGSEGGNKCKCQPIAFDLESKGGTYNVIDGTGYLTHSRTDAHGNQPVASGNVGGMAFVGFDRTFTVGDVPEVTVEETWLH